jgi:hypothetical protein
VESLLREATFPGMRRGRLPALHALFSESA